MEAGSLRSNAQLGWVSALSGTAVFLDHLGTCSRSHAKLATRDDDV